MKKILLSVFVLSILLPTLAFASFDTSLKYGSRGDAVLELQDLLQAQGFLKSKGDGRYGLVTLKAVKAFQSANGLAPDGYFGKASRIKASSILADQLQSSNTAEQADTGTITPTTSPTIASTTITSTVAGCTSTSAFSATTGQSCSSTTQPSVSNLPAGCNSTSGFSITTGQACNNTATPALNTTTTPVISTPTAISTPLPASTPVPTPVSTPIPDTYQMLTKVAIGTGTDSQGNFTYSDDNILRIWKTSQNGGVTQNGSIVLKVLKNGVPMDLTNYVLEQTSTFPNSTKESIVFGAGQLITGEKYIDSGIQKQRQPYTRIQGLPNGSAHFYAPFGNYTVTFSIPALKITQTVQVVVELLPTITTPAPKGSINIFQTIYSPITGETSDTSTTARKGLDLITMGVKTFDAQGKQVDSLPITVTTNDPDLPPTFRIVANQGFYVGKHDGNPQTNCSNDNHDCMPLSVGTFTFTFSQPDLNVSKTISLTVIDFAYQKVTLVSSVPNLSLAGNYAYPNYPTIATINVSGLVSPLRFITADYDIVSNDFTKGQDIGTLWFYIGDLYSGKALSSIDMLDMTIQPNESKNITIKVGQDGFFTHSGTFSVHLTNLRFQGKNIPVDITIPNISVQ